jgi:hypothetical protein
MPLPGLADLLRYLLAYNQSYELDAAGRSAMYERQGMTVITHNQVRLPGDDGWASGVQVVNAVNGEVLWTGPVDEVPDNEAWVHEDYIADATHSATPELRYGGLPKSLLEALDEWVFAHPEQVRQLLAEA